ncbi:MAG: DNA/RNA non-specific endonuclease [Bacteroidota bacterium]
MAKFKQNHNKGEASNGMVVRVGLFATILGALFWGFNQFMGGKSAEEEGGNSDGRTEILVDKGPGQSVIPLVDETIFPTSTTGQVIKHTYYGLSYSEEHEQAEWVAYELFKEQMYPPFVERTDNFRPDPKVRKASASTRDYKGTGYDRGHLVPAGDMNFDKKAMSETFFMSNISPQIRNFNGGIWRELEETTRSWVKKFKHLYIVTGPILNENVREQIGNNQVSVPEAYFKVLLDADEPEYKAIAFVIPNELSFQPLEKYAVSIDEVEDITGIDFFHQLLTKEDQAVLEGEYDVSLWPMNQKKFDIRVKEWNKRR